MSDPQNLHEATAQSIRRIGPGATAAVLRVTGAARKPVKVPAGTTTPDNLREVAVLASYGDASALREIKRVANLLGYRGQQGGWIYSKVSGRSICQGWMAFAHRMAVSSDSYARVWRMLAPPAGTPCVRMGPNGGAPTGRHAHLDADGPDCLES